MQINFDISDKVAIFPAKERSDFLKQVILTILDFHVHRESYSKYSMEQYLAEPFPLNKKFSKEEIRTNLAPMAVELNLKQPGVVLRTYAWFASLFGSSNVFSMEGLYEILASDKEHTTEFLASTLENILGQSQEQPKTGAVAGAVNTLTTAVLAPINTVVTPAVAVVNNVVVDPLKTAANKVVENVPLLKKSNKRLNL